MILSEISKATVSYLIVACIVEQKETIAASESPPFVIRQVIDERTGPIRENRTAPA
jgi:hypothetical protein